MTSHAPFAPGPCPFEIDDGAYILGALGPAERAAYERHLATCPPCRDGVTQLAVLPGLLGRLDPATALPATTAPPTLLPRVLAAMRARRAQQRRRRVLAGVAGVIVTVAVAAAVGIGVQFARVPGTPAPTGIAYLPMTVGGDGPRVEAEIGLMAQPTGTLVGVRCLYHGSTERSWQIWLVVYPRDDEAEPVGSWVATGGVPVEVTAMTHYSPDEIARIELRSANNTALAWYTP